MRIPTVFSSAALLLASLSLIPASRGADSIADSVASPARSPVPVSGLVLGPGGSPLPGARVLLVPLGAEADDSRRELDGQTGPAPAASTVTGPDGAFRLEAPAAGAWKVAVEAPGMVPRESRLLLADETEVPAVELQPDAKLEVRVTHGAGSPVPGARVRVAGTAPFSQGLARAWQVPVRFARADAQGAAGLSRTAGEVLLVQAGTDGQPSTAEREVRTGSVRLQLPAGASRRVRVLGATGAKPLGGVLVQVGEHRWPAGRTAADGLFSIPLPTTLLSHQEKILLTAQDGRRLEMSIGLPGKGGQEPLPLRLPALVTVSGRILSAQDGHPVAGALIWSQDTGEVQRAAADGTYRIKVPADQEVRLAVAARGFQAAEITASPAAPPLRIVLQRSRIGFGHVVDRAEKPVAGVRIVLRAAGPGAPRYGAATGPDGRFQVRDLPKGLYELTARGRGYAPLTVPGLRVPPGSGATDLGTVILPAGVAVEGQVVDPQGRPVPAAEVRLTAAGGSRTGPGPGEESSSPALTGPDGSFRIEDRRPGETVDLGVRRTGYAPAAAPGLRIPPERPVRIVLQPTAMVEGSTVDPDGKPVAGALVFVFPSDPVHVGGGAGSDRTLQAQSDGNGRFRVEGVTPGSFELRATAPGRQEARLTSLEAQPGQDLQGVEVVLAAGAVLTGRVLSSAGQPVAGAEMSLLPEGSAPPLLSGGSDLSDEQGRYRLEGISPGTHTVQAEHEGYRPTLRRLDVRADRNTLDLTLEPGAILSGRVVDPQRAPVAGARVFLRPSPGGSSPRGLPSGTSGPDGSFNLSGLADGTYRLLAEKAGFARSRDGQEVVVAGRSMTGIEIQLTAGGTIAGKLLGLDFTDLPQVQVRTDAGQTGQILPDGDYRIDDVAPGSQRVVATLSGGSRQAEGQVALEPGASEARLDLDFGKGLKLTGRVLRDGEPVAGEGVLLSGTGGAGRWDDTDLDGRFHFAGLEAGRYTLRVISRRAEEQHREEVEVAADRDLLIELSTASISGRVVDATDHSPIANARVVLTAPKAQGGADGSFPSEALADSRGVFQLRGVAAGSWKVRALVADYEPAEADVQVAGAPVEGLELALRATEGLTLDVLLPSGSPPGTVRAAVLDPGGRVIASGSYTPGQGGRMRITGVPPGAWDLLLDADGAALVSVPVTAPGHAGRVILPPPGGLSLRVPALADGQAGAKVRLSDSRDKPFRTLWGGQAVAELDLTAGTLSLQRLPPGVWRVTVTAGDGRTWTRTAVIAPGSTAQLILK